MDTFFASIWQIISENRICASKESERLVFAIVKYIGEASSIADYSDFVKQNLALLFTVLILPNISITT